MRRNLPTGPTVADYEFADAAGPVRLSELFDDPDQPLILYHFMFGKDHDAPCPMCAMWADGWNGVASHVRHNVNFALVSSAPIDQTTTMTLDRGWTNLRWISAADNTFKLDIGGEDSNGNQSPFISVYELIDGQLTLSYSGAAQIAEGHWRGVDLLSPVWHLLDLTRDGRKDWMPSLG